MRASISPDASLFYSPTIDEKSQRYNAAYCQNACYIWVKKHGLIDPMEHWKAALPNA